MRLRQVAVIGDADASEQSCAFAEELGRRIARNGWALISGGRGGVMEAASRGAAEAGGLTVGILPVAKKSEHYPNPWVMVPICTGVGSARNQFNVLSATLCVAIGGGPGTLSEIALALKAGTPVWCWNSWSIQPPQNVDRALPRVFETSDDLLIALSDELQ